MQDLRATITFVPPADLTEDDLLESLEALMPDWGPTVAVNFPDGQARTFDVTVSHCARSAWSLVQMVEAKLALIFFRNHLDADAVVGLHVCRAD